MTTRAPKSASEKKQPARSAEQIKATAQPVDLALLAKASVNPDHLTSSDVLSLQRTVGNRTTTRLIQAKLTVGPASDRYEQEADRVAQQVLTMPAPASQPPALQRSPEAEEELQLMPLAASMTPLVQRLDADCPEVDETFEQQLAASRGGGSPLPAGVRSFMEPRFGAEFTGVRLHTGSQSAQLNRSVSAQAFTYGQDIYLGEGKSDVESAQGKQLLAHELTQVVQQTGHVQRAEVDEVRTPTTSESIQRQSVIQRTGPEEEELQTKPLINPVPAPIQRLTEGQPKPVGYSELKSVYENGTFQNTATAIFTAAGIDAAAISVSGHPAISQTQVDSLFTAFVGHAASHWDYNANSGARNGGEILLRGEDTTGMCQDLANAFRIVYWWLCSLAKATPAATSIPTVEAGPFVTKVGVVNFDASVPGNVIDGGSRRFLYTGHWVVDIGGKLYDPTTMRSGAEAGQSLDYKVVRTVGSTEDQKQYKDTANRLLINQINDPVAAQGFGSAYQIVAMTGEQTSDTQALERPLNTDAMLDYAREVAKKGRYDKEAYQALPGTDLNSPEEELALLDCLAYALDHLKLGQGQTVDKAKSRRTARRSRLAAMKNTVRERKERLLHERPPLMAASPGSYNERLAGLVLESLERVKRGFWSR